MELNMKIASLECISNMQGTNEPAIFIALDKESEKLAALAETMHAGRVAKEEMDNLIINEYGGLAQAVLDRYLDIETITIEDIETDDYTVIRERDESVPRGELKEEIEWATKLTPEGADKVIAMLDEANKPDTKARYFVSFSDEDPTDEIGGRDNKQLTESQTDE